MARCSSVIALNLGGKKTLLCAREFETEYGVCVPHGSLSWILCIEMAVPSSTPSAMEWVGEAECDERGNMYLERSIIQISLGS